MSTPVGLVRKARDVVQRVGFEFGGFTLGGRASLGGRAPGSWPGPELVRLLDEFEADLVVDVGAYTGEYGARLRRSGYRGRLVSFEPLARPRAELLRTAAEDEAWSVLPYALGDTSGSALLHIADDAGAASSLLPMVPRDREAAPHAEYVDRQPVEVHRLDELWEQIVAPGERLFLNLAVQGYEAHVLRGLGEYADELVGLQMETSFVPLYEDGPLFDEALTYARESLGLSLMSIVPGGADPVSGRMLQCGLVLFREDL